MRRIIAGDNVPLVSGTRAICHFYNAKNKSARLDSRALKVSRRVARSLEKVSGAQSRENEVFVNEEEIGVHALRILQ